MKIFFKFFITKDEKHFLGPGKVQLLRLVDEYGSLRKAVREMGMSYRWAWGKIKSAEEAIGIPLLVQSESSKGKANMLTRDAQEIIAWFSRTEAELAKVLKQAEETQPKALKQA